MTAMQRPLSLIPVNLKEAALDSPTFRAVTIHFSEQVDTVERWLDAYVRSTTKFCQEINHLDDLVTTHLSKLVPSLVSEAVLDHDYTLLGIQRLGEGTKEFWAIVIQWAKKMESVVVEPLLNLQRKDLKAFKEYRRVLDASQSKYDTLLQRYASQPKTREPSALREEAFQLHEARKAYIRASFDFCVAAPQLRATLDKVVTKCHSDLWREQIKSRTKFAGLDRFTSEMERIRSWSDSIEEYEPVFRGELLAARKEIEDQAKNLSRPARELDEYATSTVPFLTSRGKENAGVETTEVSEKSGWLFLRTIHGKPARTTWSRRWYYLKDGVFGALMQSQRTGGVEESDKIGVLLCNVKPAFQEDRRFCFEVKTTDQTILLQAETQQDLTSWLEIFEAAKRAAIHTASAFAIKPAATIKIKESTADLHVSAEPLAPATLANPPMPTSLSHQAVVAGAKTEVEGGTSGLMANHWGSTNWGVVTSDPTHHRSGSIDSDTAYPAELKAQDAQFRMLFPTASKEDKVLLVFRASWNPNAQEFPGRVYVTVNEIFFYSHHLGLVLVSNISLGAITDVEYHSGTNSDQIVLRFGEDNKIIVKTFLEPVKLLHRRLRLLVHNHNSQTPLTMHELFEELTKLEEAEDELQPKERLKLPVDPVVYEPFNFKKTFEQEFDISSKSLYHVLFGDKSAVFQTVYRNRRKLDIQQFPWISPTRRECVYDIVLDGRTIRIVDRQTIQQSEDHICYVVLDQKIPWQSPLADSFVMQTSIVITHVAKAKCKLTLWTALRWRRNSFFRGLVEEKAIKDLEEDTAYLGNVVSDQAKRLGSQSRTIKAIRIFGQVGAEVDPKLEVPPAFVTQTHRTLKGEITKLALKGVMSVLGSVTGAGKQVLSSIQLNWILIAGLAVLSLFNIQLGTRTGIAYWQVNRANHLADSIHLSKSKSIYMKDLEESIQAEMPALSSECAQKFTASPHNPRLRHARDQWAIRRHNLLVSLRMINRLERNYLMTEWESWILDENEKCMQVLGLLGNKTLNALVEPGQALQLIEYCKGCRKDLEALEGTDLSKLGSLDGRKMGSVLR